MHLLVPKDATSPNSVPAIPASPVAWYLIVWILLSLASNSMAQPSGRICGASIRYRVFLCSSPIFCFADGIAILVRLLVTSVYLHVSPLKASRLAILSRTDERHHSTRNKDICFDDLIPSEVHRQEGPPTANVAAWPRWLFSLAGTVPAAIQLASFSGVPGTQVFGLMFVSSFAVIELATFLSTFKEDCSTIPEVLRYVRIQGIPIGEQEDRFKAYKLVVRLEWFETVLFIIAFIAHFALMLELIYPALFRAVLAIRRIISKWATIPMVLCEFLLLLTTVILSLFSGKWPSLERRFSWRKSFAYFVSSLFMTDLIVVRPSDNVEHYMRDHSYTIALLAILFHCLNLGMSKICERYPSIAKALLIDRRPWDLEKIEHVPEQHRIGIESDTGVINTRAWLSFCIFLSDFLVCIVWYAVIYDQAETANPGWTNVL